MNDVWFSSDLHLGHTNILKYCNRPWSTVEEMNEALIENWNDRVHADDVVWLLGDVAMGGLTGEPLRVLIRRLNGRKFLILGNHDQKIARKPQEFLGSGLFEAVYPFLEKKVNGQRITFCHYAMKVYNKSHHGAWHVFGHSHGTIPDDPHQLSMDVGVDPNRYRPVHFDELQAHMDKKDFQPIDHHGKE